MKKNYGNALLLYFSSLLLFDLFDNIFNFHNKLLVVLNFILFPTLLIPVVYLLKEDLKVKVFEKDKSTVKKSLLVICLGFFITLVGTIIISLVSTYFDTSTESNTINTLKAFPILIIPMVLIAPILEELIFRKIIFNIFSKKFNILVSILFTSLLFAGWHMSLLSFPNLFWLSMVISYSYYLTNRLSVPIILHIVWNLFVSSINLFAK